MKNEKKVYRNFLLPIILLILFVCADYSFGLNTPSVTASSITYYSIKWSIRYPSSGAWGNKLDLWNSSTGQWTKIVQSDYTTDGQYTTSGLSPKTTYMCRLTWNENNTWKVRDCYATTLNTPSNTAGSVTYYSISWSIRYPSSGAWGNKLDLWNSSTGQWTKIVQSDYTTDGQYTTSGLSPKTTYMCRLTWNENNTWKVRDCYATTLNTPSNTASSITYYSISWSIRYPSSGAWGNKLDLWNSSTGQWTKIVQSDYTTDGQYTTSGLTPKTTYMCRLTWNENNTWKVRDEYATTLNTPAVSVSACSETSITWNATYPSSGAWGNKLELWNSVTGEWTRIVQSDYTTDGQYTTSGLSPKTTYMCRLTWNENNTWKVRDVYATTLNTPAVSVSACSATSITWNATYPSPGAWGNKLELWNSVTGEWTRIVQSDYAVDGQYTSSGLTPKTTYMCRLTWNENNTWKVLDRHATTLGLPPNIQVLSDNFETGSGSSPDSWSTAMWNSSYSVMTWESSGGINNSKCISITSIESNDAVWKRTFNLTPDQGYVATVHIKGENITPDKGANICIVDTWNASDGYSGTFDWKEISFSFKVPSSGVVEIGCRLGYWYGCSTGKVWFDDFSLTPMIRIAETDKKVSLLLESEDITNSGITPSNMTRWVNHLDDAYDSYAELTGWTPFSGEKIDVLAVRQYPGGWAVAGNPIQWFQPYVRSELTGINNTDNWSFGILHEIGHDFDMEGWNWDGEFWANTKMYYVVETNETQDAKVWHQTSNGQDKCYTGQELKQYYYADATDSYLNTINSGIFKYDALTYCIIRIREAIGWEPFKATFRNFVTSGENPAANLDKFNRFLELLQDNYSPGGNHVENTFLPGELELIRANIK